MAEQLDESILATIKKPLGRAPVDDPFDDEILTFINSTVSNLNQLGVGPREGLVIDKDTVWSALFQGRKDLENVKSYIFLKVRLLHDSGSMTPQLISAYERMIAEQEFRIAHTVDPFIPQTVPTEISEEV